MYPEKNGDNMGLSFDQYNSLWALLTIVIATDSNKNNVALAKELRKKLESPEKPKQMTIKELRDFYKGHLGL